MYKIKEGDIHMEVITKEMAIKAITDNYVNPTEDEIEKAINDLRGINLTRCKAKCPNYGMCDFLCDVTFVG